MPFLVSLLLQSVKNTASSSHKFDSSYCCFTYSVLCFHWSWCGSWKKKWKSSCYFCFMLKNLCLWNSRHRVATITEWNVLLIFPKLIGLRPVYVCVFSKVLRANKIPKFLYAILHRHINNFSLYVPKRNQDSGSLCKNPTIIAISKSHTSLWVSYFYFILYKLECSSPFNNCVFLCESYWGWEC